MKNWMFNETKNPTIVTKVFDLMGLNLLFILTCIPIITIGASLSALYSVTLKMADADRDYFVVRDYFKSFKRNFIQGSILFGILLTILSLFFLAILVINQFGTPDTIVSFMVLFLVTMVVLVTLYLFPLLAYYDNKTVVILKNAIIMAYQQMAKSILMFIIGLVIAVLPLININLGFIWIILAFSLTAYLQSLILIRIFKSYAATKIKEEE